LHFLSRNQSKPAISTHDEHMRALEERRHHHDG
jgi:hypothetical protein